MSIASEISRLSSNISDSLDAVAAKGVTVPSDSNSDDLPGLIALIGQGGDANPIAPENDVIFIDYDGTIRHSYTAAEFLSLTEMPANPTHDGLVAQGWNWTLADAKEYVTQCGGIVIGQNYITESGATEIDLSLIPGATDGIISFAVNGEAQIDFGDGSSPVTVTGSNLSTRIDTQHNWPSAGGDFTVKILAISGTIKLGGQGYGSGQGSWLYWGGYTTDNSRNITYRNCIRRIRVGQTANNFNGQPFSWMQSCESISIPVSITDFGDYPFTTDYSLMGIVIPKNTTYFGAYGIPYTAIRYASLSKNAKAFSRGPAGRCFYDNHLLRKTNIPLTGTTIDSNAFENCYSLPKIFIPTNITTIRSYAFSKCFSLLKIIISASVTTVESYAFQNCYSLKEIHLLPATPPTLTGTSTFMNVPSDCVFYVPSGCITAYQEATNWSTYASQMQEEPQ